jgi:hypothetical protein
MFIKLPAITSGSTEMLWGRTGPLCRTQPVAVSVTISSCGSLPPDPVDRPSLSGVNGAGVAAN